MDNAIISVIVPIYNVEKYLSRCIESIINQTYKNLEIVLVDDESPDNCPQMCDEYAKRDNRIKVIHKKNGGVSAARNTGIENATGKWIVFVDGDDLLEKDILENAVHKCETETGKYMVQWNFKTMRDDELIIQNDIYAKEASITELCAYAIHAYINSSFYLGYYFRAIWGKLLLKSVITENNIRFDEKLYMGEDALFVVEYLLHIDKVYVLNNYGYYYVVHKFSATQRYKSNLYEQSILQMNHIKSFEDSDKSQTITDATQAFAWAQFLELYENSIRGIKAKEIPRKKRFDDAISWYNTYINYFQRKTVVLPISKKYRLFEKIVKMSSVRCMLYIYPAINFIMSKTIYGR